MNTRLFIENREIDLDETVQFAITKQFEELSNPTTIINDWSKTVSIPFTAHNNEIFGHLYSIDRVIVGTSTTKTTGIYFNPLKKLDFRLVWNDSVVMVGYAKLQQIKQVAGKGTYEFTLFGQLGKIFQTMQKITFDNTYEDSSYIIDGSQYVDTYIGKELVSESWNSEGQSTSLLKKKDETGYHITDIIGFAPNNSFNEGFDYKAFQVNQGSSNTFQKVLESLDFQTKSGIAPETAIPNGLLPREIGEYRSYLQLPYIYWNKLFKMFQEKAESLTGYTFDLDKDWFNTSNPYWYKLVYMLKDFFSDGISDDNNFTNIYNWWIPSSGYISWGSAGYNQTKSTNLGATIVSEDLPILETGALSTNTGYNYKMNDYSGRVQSTLPFSFRFLTYQEYYMNVQLNPANGFVFNVRVYDVDTEEVLSEATYLICRSNTTIDKSAYQNVIEYDGKSLGYDSSTLTDRFDFDVPLNMFIPRGHKVSFNIRGSFVNNNMPFTRPGSQMWLPTVNLYLRSNENTINLTKEVRSNSHFTFNDLWNNDYNVFGEILKYCKTYRIVIYTDDANKKVVFTPLYKYFQNITISDCTEKIDKSKDFDFNIAPITFGKKYVLFNYKDSSTKLGKQYKEKYGYNYGEYRLTTDYNFDEAVDKLFNDVNGGMVTTDNVLSWENLYTYKKVVFSFPSEIYVYCKDKDNKFVDVFGQFYFHNGLRDFSNEEDLHMRSVYISDDSDFMNGNNLYFYYQNPSASSSVTTYPALDIICGDNICLFNVPKENYTYLKNYSGKKSIYTNFWKKYIEERYNIQNKVINCYLMLKPVDFINFKFNNLVKYCNQLCIINKIYDYDITSDRTTKVDLITIQDIGGYNKSDYKYDYIIASKNSLTIPYDYYKRITIKSSGNWKLHADDWTNYLTVYPTSGTAGETEVIIGSTDENNGYTLTFDLLDESGETVIESEQVECNVGGTSTISISGDLYTEYVIGSPAITRQVNSETNWKLIKVDNGSDVSIRYNPQIGVDNPAGTSILSYSCVGSMNTGLVDFLVENEAGDIASIRVNFKRI